MSEKVHSCPWPCETVGTLDTETHGGADSAARTGNQRDLSAKSHGGLRRLQLCRVTTSVLGSRPELISEDDTDEKSTGLLLNVGSLILVVALVIDFVWVISTALSAAGH